MLNLFKKRKHKTQLVRIKEHLKKGYTITPQEALKKYGCFRLSAVIHRLRTEHGMTILTARPNNYAVYKAV